MPDSRRMHPNLGRTILLRSDKPNNANVNPYVYPLIFLSTMTNDYYCKGWYRKFNAQLATGFKSGLPASIRWMLGLVCALLIATSPGFAQFVQPGTGVPGTFTVANAPQTITITSLPVSSS